MSLQVNLQARIRAVLSGVADFGKPSVDLDVKGDFQFENGVADFKADTIFTDEREIAASASEDLDLRGALKNALGGDAIFAKVKAILIVASDENTNNVVVGAAASNPFVGPLGGTTPTISLQPGGVALLTAPKGGWPVGAGTSDILKIANSSSGTPVKYGIAVVGTSS